MASNRMFVNGFGVSYGRASQNFKHDWINEKNINKLYKHCLKIVFVYFDDYKKMCLKRILILRKKLTDGLNQMKQ